MRVVRLFFELEALAIVAAVKKFTQWLEHRNIVIFNDNEGVHGAFVRCMTENSAGQRLIEATCEAEELLGGMFWYERVPSSSNPADRPSREEPCGLCEETRLKVEPDLLWMWSLGRLPK